MITPDQLAIMGAGRANAAPQTDLTPGDPWTPWAAPVMVLAGVASGPGGTVPWLWLAGKCGWFLGFSGQYDPDEMAFSARRHRESCTECGEIS